MFELGRSWLLRLFELGRWWLLRLFECGRWWLCCSLLLVSSTHRVVAQAPDEIAHIEAFPSVLRLLIHGPLLAGTHAASPTMGVADGCCAHWLLCSLEPMLTGCYAHRLLYSLVAVLTGPLCSSPPHPTALPRRAERMRRRRPQPPRGRAPSTPPRQRLNPPHLLAAVGAAQSTDDTCN